MMHITRRTLNQIKRTPCSWPVERKHVTGAEAVTVVDRINQLTPKQRTLMLHVIDHFAGMPEAPTPGAARV